MRPAKMFREFEEPKRMIVNGPRPSPLSINKASHLIHKPSSSSYLADISSQAPVAKQKDLRTNAQHMQPVIIYTHSPKIIYTQARNFMALVQKLTGLSRSEDENTLAESQVKNQDSTSGDKNHVKHASVEDNESSSVVTDEKYGGVPDYVKESLSSTVSPTRKMPNANFADFPLFTPNSSHFFKYLDEVFPSPNIAIPPSFVEFMKGLPEY